uniref:PiggyBac transposable element-derived protein domain-containing protein n=1 Tax=Sinocyclocheilus grahami TaxID=75366 RepID=A0A672T0W2_SINGR
MVTIVTGGITRSLCTPYVILCYSDELSFRLTLSQVLDLLDADDPGPAICNIAVVPKTEKDAIESDCDSDASDMDFTGDSAHLPSRILNSTAELFRSDHFEEVEPACEDQPNFTIRTRSLTKKLESASSSLLHFRKSKKTAKSHLPDYIVYEPTAAQCLKATNANPLDVFLAMYPPSLRELPIEMSNLYSAQNKDKPLNLSMEELLVFDGVLLSSGYCTVPRRHLLWSLDDDVHNNSISNAMRRNKFDEIMASIHVVDNTKCNDDPFFKVRPIFQELNSSYKILPISKWLSVDESMIPYYGRHGYKQFIKGKPIRYGYKVWSLASSGGYLYHMEPYAGVHTLLQKTGLGQGPSVVLGLAEKAGVPGGCNFMHDNLFTTLSLIDEMTKRGYGCIGTLGQNQLFDVPFKPINEFQKLPWVSTEFLSEGEKLLVRWRDNSVVTVASNVENVYSEAPVKRWNKEGKAYDYLQQPQIIRSYKQQMGGVDLHDLQVSRYHSTIRSKKWWWPIYAWTLHSAVVNSWLFHRVVMNGDYDLLGFQRVVAQSLLKKFGIAPKGHGRPSSMLAAVTDIPRCFMNHNICKYGRTSFGCEKCARPMHIECFKKFHNLNHKP